MINSEQQKGILERLVYAAAMALLTKLVQKGYIDGDMAAYIAGGAVAAVGGVWAWWVNRPQSLNEAAKKVNQ